MLKEEFKKLALYYIHDKKFSVIPTGKDKIPLATWRDYQNRFATDEEIERWSNIPDVQLGIVTGSLSNLTVVDVEKGGDASFLPQNTTIVETGGGGAHFYFQNCPEVKNKARIRELVDIRSEGGYVVAPGSISSKGNYTLIQDLPLLPFPKDLFSESQRPSNVNIFASVTNNVVADYPGYGTGSRNEEMTKYIGHVLTQIHPSKWDTEAWDIIIKANGKNTPPLYDRELRASYESVKRMEVNKNPDRWRLNKNNVFEPVKEWKEDEEKGEGRILLMSEAAKLQHIDISCFYPFGFKIFDDEIMGGAIPGDVVVIAGQPGEGKTSFAMNIAKNFVTSGQKVLFFSYEVMLQFIWDKFKLMGMKDDDCLYCPFKNITGNVEWIEKKIKEAKEKHDVKFVVIDHLGYLVPRSETRKGQENYSIYLTGIMRDLKSIARNEEIVIILPVHVRKRGTYHKKNAVLDMEEIAHSNGIAQESDLVFLIQRENTVSSNSNDKYTGYSLITLGKNRRGSKNPMSFFSMIDGMFVRSETYKGVDSMGSKSPSYSGKIPFDQSVTDRLQNEMKKDDLLREKINSEEVPEDDDGLPF